MRNPARKAAIWFAVLAAGLAMWAYGWPGSEPWSLDSLAYLVVVAGAIFSLIYGLNALGQRKLLRERDAGALVARWHVGATDWDRFRAVDAARAAEHPDLANDLAIRRETPPLGVEILVGDTGVLAGDSYHVLRRFGLPFMVSAGWLGPPADPECLELMVSHKKRYGWYQQTLRLPVPAAARAQDVRAYEHFAGRIPPPPKPFSPRAFVGFAVLLLPAGAAAFALGWQLERGDTANTLMGLGGGLVLSAALALILALWTLIARRPEGRE